MLVCRLGKVGFAQQFGRGNTCSLPTLASLRSEYQAKSTMFTFRTCAPTYKFSIYFPQSLRQENRSNQEQVLHNTHILLKLIPSLLCSDYLLAYGTDIRRKLMKAPTHTTSPFSHLLTSQQGPAKKGNK